MHCCSLEHSTPVTAAMVPAMIEDVFKVRWLGMSFHAVRKHFAWRTIAVEMHASYMQDCS